MKTKSVSAYVYLAVASIFCLCTHACYVGAVVNFADVDDS